MAIAVAVAAVAVAAMVTQAGARREQAAGQATAAAAGPRCFGAAARDPNRPCVDARFKFTVTPSPADALITPNAPCLPRTTDDAIFHALGASAGSLLYFHECVFATQPPLALSGTALVGDSHAETWRAALDVVGTTLKWEGASITRSSCPFTDAPPLLPQAIAAQCVRWRQLVVAWFDANPQVSTAFVAQHATATVIPARGKSTYATQLAGYLAAWRSLPATVKHIVVLRDTPQASASLTAGCVQAAVDRRRPPGLACALPRARSLPRDPAVDAAARLGPRASVIDLTRFFCDRTLCYPVIGGVLVYKDGEHMTRLFSQTLGPYLRHEVGKLLAAWAAGSS
ncbi:MAG: SGNH hydrolase domain-containing protein [Solirubrobacteraceae bacterium]